MNSARLGVAIVVTVVAVLIAESLPLGPVTAALAIVVLVALGCVAVGWPGAVPGPRVSATEQAQRQRWEQAARQHDDVLTAYAKFELDPAMLLRFPGMWDLSAPPIVNFQDALELAGSLRSDEYPGDMHAQEYIGAVAMLRTDWAAADRFARTTGTDGLSNADAVECRKALGLFQHAQGASGAERATYLEKVLGTLDTLAERGVVAAPAPMHDALSREVQRAIGA